MKDKINYEIVNLPIDSLFPDENQPRKFIDPKQISRLAESIKEHGIYQPIKFVKRSGKNIIISGHLRYEAAKSAKLSEIPAIEITNEEDTALIALIENIAQNTMLPMEEALALKALKEKTNKSQNELASSLSIPKASMSDKLKLAKLPEYIQLAVLHEPLWKSQQLRKLADISDSGHQKEIFLKMKAKIEKKKKAEKPKIKKVEKLSEEAKLQKKYAGLRKATEKFKMGFEERLQKILPDGERKKYKDRIIKVYSAIDELINELQNRNNNI